MHQAGKTLLFLLYVSPQLFFSCQAMEEREKEEDKKSKLSRKKTNFSWDSLNRSWHNLGSLLISDKPAGLLRRRKTYEEGKESKKNERDLRESNTSPTAGSPSVPDRSITYSIADMIKLFDDKKTFINPYHRAYVVRGLSNITSDEKRSSFFDKAQSFLLEEMDGYDFAFLLYVISHLSKENTDFFFIAPSHLPAANDRFDRLLLLRAFYKIPREEWNKLVAFVQKNKFFPDTESQARDKALNLIFSYLLSKIPLTFRELFLKYIPKAIPEPYLLHYLLKLDQNILTDINEIPQSTFQEVLEGFIGLSPFTPESTAKESLDLVDVLSRIPFKELGHVLRGPKRLIGNRSDMLHKGDVIQTLFFIPERMTVKPTNIGDEPRFVPTKGIIVDLALSLITPQMDGRDISKVINALDGFLIAPEGQDDFNPSRVFAMQDFAQFVNTELKPIRENVKNGKVDSQIIYAASIMPYEKRKIFSEHFNKFSPSFLKVSPEEILHRFLYLSEVPQGHESNAVALLNKAVQGMSEKERIIITKIASALVDTELENFTLLVDKLEEQSISRFYRPLIIEVFSEIGSIHRENFVKRPYEKFFNKSFFPPFEQASPMETYLRALFLSCIPEEKEQEAIAILNNALRSIESRDRESILKKALTFPTSDLKYFEDLVLKERWG